MEIRLLCTMFHGLMHIYEDCEYFNSSLNSLSAFPFENYLQTLKRYVKNRNNPIVQVAKRLSEIEAANLIPSKKKKFATISTKI